MSERNSKPDDGVVAGGVAAPKTRDFAVMKTTKTTKDVGRGGQRMQSIPIKAAPKHEHESVWQRTMKVTTTAFSKMGGKG